MTLLIYESPRDALHLLALDYHFFFGGFFFGSLLTQCWFSWFVYQCIWTFSSFSFLLLFFSVWFSLFSIFYLYFVTSSSLVVFFFSSYSERKWTAKKARREIAVKKERERKTDLLFHSSPNDAASRRRFFSLSHTHTLPNTQSVCVCVYVHTHRFIETDTTPAGPCFVPYVSPAGVTVPAASAFGSRL